MLQKLINKPKSRKIAVLLALLGTVTPLAGIHKFYLGQPLWGVLYLILGWSTPMAQIACAFEAVLYLVQDVAQFNWAFNQQLPDTGVTRIYLQDKVGGTQRVEEIATAVRELDKLRLDGLISEYEFEQKRRQLIERIS